MSGDIKKIGTIEELLEIVDLQSVSFLELGAVVTEEFTFPLGDPGELRISLGGAGSHFTEGGSMLEIFFELDVNGETVQISTKPIVRFAVEGGPYFVDPDVMSKFMGNVAIMAAFPYVREAVQDLSLRTLGYPVTPPLLRLGQLTFEIDEESKRRLAEAEK